jgi:hypothetical protein
MMPSGWINASKVARSLRGWDHGEERSRIMVMAGNEDKLMGVQLMEDMARDYRQEVYGLVGKKKLDVLFALHDGTMEPIKETEEDGDAGVSMVVVKEAGHHIQNDVQAERVAEVFRNFLEGLGYDRRTTPPDSVEGFDSQL